MLKLLVLLILISSGVVHARGGLICADGDRCRPRGLITNKAAGPTKSDSIRLNPASVPVEPITGVEAIYYDSSFSFGLVKGLGRVGAAISPSNNEETFFGPQAIEDPNEYLKRMNERKKYDSPKYTLATAFTLFSKEGGGFNNRNLSFGLMARYNKASGRVHPGAGLQGVLGFVYAGASIYEDDAIVNSIFGGKMAMNSQVVTYSGGLSFESFMLDYSTLQTSGGLAPPSTTSVFTLSGFLGRAILTASYRVSDSEKPAYDFSTNSLVEGRDVPLYFAGVQYRIANFLVLGAFYNYYLLREVSLGTTFYF